MAMDLAGNNRCQLERVLAHYEGNPRKREAAEWLIANMPGNGTTWSEGIQEFADSVGTRTIGNRSAAA